MSTILLTTQNTPQSPSAGKVRVFIDSSDGALKSVDSNGNVSAYNSLTEADIESLVAGLLHDSSTVDVVYNSHGHVIQLDVIQTALDHTNFLNIGTNSHAQIDSHIAATNNPHSVTKGQVGLGNVDNTSDANKPVSTATQSALNLKADASSVYTKTESDSNFEPKNSNIQSHISSTSNPHMVTKTQVGLGNVDNTSDLNKPVSTATQSALDLKADSSSVYTKTESSASFEPKNANIQSHIESTSNPHMVTKAQVGLGDVDNTSDLNKPISTATQAALDTKQNVGNYVTALSGDVSASGPGSAVATVNSVGGSSASDLHSAELLANAATNLNTASALVRRDGSGNFSAGSITASLIGHASLDLALTGGTMSGNIDMGGSKIINHGTPSNPNDVVNKAYADALTGGIIWLQPVADVCLADDSLSTPPASPPYSVVYIIGLNATGAWAGLEGHAIQWKAPSGGGSNTWVDLFDRPVQAGDRFLVAARHGSNNIGGSFIGKKNYVCQVTGGSAGSYTYSFTMPNDKEGVFDNDIDSDHYGQSYVYNSGTSAWVQIGGPSVVSAGLALAYSASVLNVQTDGSTISVNGSNKLVGSVKSGESTDINGLLKGNGSVLSAASAGTDYESPITAGTTSQYFRGDKTFQNLTTAVVSELTNLYFTDVRAQTAAVENTINAASTTKAPSGSAVSTALAGKQPTGNYITALTGDVSATGPGSVSGTVNSVGGSSAANIHSAELLANAATNLNTSSAIVKRDASGNFSAGTITANLSGNASTATSATTATTSTNFTGSLSGDVTGTQSATVVSTVGGKTATQVATSVNDTTAATSVNTPSTIVKRDASGNFSAGTITASLTGTASGNEPLITAGTTAQYFRGDKTFQTLNTTAVVEATNLYYTDTRVATYINTQKGQPNGLASLDANGLVPVAQLPGMVNVDFGDGSDGAVTISANTTLTRDMFYSSLTINSGITLNTAGYKVFVSGTLLNNGTISNAGGAGTAASGTTAGTGGSAAPSGTLGASTSGTNGGASGGGTAATTSAVAFSMGSTGGTSGAGGGATNGVAAGIATYTPMRTASQAMLYGLNLIGGGTGAAGGGGGATAAGATPGAGGGGGGGGGAIVIWSSTLTNNGTITAAGGNGGAGGNGISNGGNGGGGGGGGGGGFVFIIHGAITLGTITAAGGTGGTGGAKTGSGTAGTTGSNGTNGRVIRFNALTQTWA